MEKLNPKISVIIPVYNVEKYLNRCVESILNQTFTDFQLILINDGSIDNSLKICREYEIRDSRIKVIDKINGGSSSARNVGLANAVGDWIIYFDSDDWVEADMLQELYDAAVQNNADIAASGFFLDDGVGNKQSYLYPYTPIEPKDEIYRVDMQYSSVWNKLVRRNLYEKYDIQFIDGVRMWDDLVVTTRLRFHSSKTIIVNKPLYHYFCAPRESICINDAEKYPFSQIKVVEFLSSYFKAISETDYVIKKIIISLKLTAKKNLFTVKSEERFNQWKSLYKEENQHIMSLKHLPVKKRLFMYIASKLSYRQLMRLYVPYKKLFKGI